MKKIETIFLKLYASIRFSGRNYQTNKCIDTVLFDIIKNVNSGLWKCEIDWIGDIKITTPDYTISLWNNNHYYAWLSSASKNDLAQRKNLWDEQMPSKYAMLLFKRFAASYQNEYDCMNDSAKRKARKEVCVKINAIND